jgi:hypothetical protein
MLSECAQRHRATPAHKPQVKLRNPTEEGRDRENMHKAHQVVIRLQRIMKPPAVQRRQQGKREPQEDERVAG